MQVLAIVGPTATGKSDLAVALARRLGGEVVNADSMQLYRGMDVGTAKPSPEEQAGVPHHLLDVWPVTRTASVADYQVLGRAVVDDLLARGRLPVVVGGSGLYLRAALDAMTFPGTDPVLRAALEAELADVGPGVLHARLASLDAAAAARMEPTNGRRVVRALEVVTLTGAMPGAMTRYDAHYDAIYLGLCREDLDGRVVARIDRMWEPPPGRPSLLDEVRALVGQGLAEGVTAARALGYAQMLRVLAGQGTLADARGLTVTATRRFVRRQRAWFRRDPRIHWLDAARTDLLAASLDALAVSSAP